MDAQLLSHPEQEQAIARLLACRYGDGGVYMPRHAPTSAILKVAIEGGFVSEDGFVTRAGRQLLAKHVF